MRKRTDKVVWWMVGAIAVLLQLAVPCTVGKCAVSNTAGKKAAKTAFNAQIPFIANNGQMDAQAAYVARTFGGSFFVTHRGELVYALPKSHASYDALTGSAGKESVSCPVENTRRLSNGSTGGIVIREALIDGNGLPLVPHAIRGESTTPTKIHYFEGNDPSKWETDIATYERINYGEVYEGIDFELYAHGNNVEKLFTVHPGGKSEEIQLRIEGVDGLRINKDGALEAVSSSGIVTFTKPVAYQIIQGKRVEVKAGYKVDSTPSFHGAASSVYSFEIASYDKTEDLIIDPLLASSFLGGGSMDLGVKIALDNSGNIIVSGVTDSLDFPSTQGAYDASITGNQDIFVVKLNPAGDQLLFATFIGGSGDEYYSPDDPFELYHFGMAVDDSGDIYVTNNTESSDFPVTPGAYDTTFNGGDSDVFVAKLSSTGDQLLYATYIGGSDTETGGGIAVDSAGNAYVSGTTYSTNFPTTSGAYARNYRGGESDMFAVKINSSGNSLVYSTFLGGSYWDESTDIVVDSSGCAYVIGGGDSNDYPTTAGAFDTSYNDDRHYYDIYLTKINSTGSGLVYSSYLGGSNKEWSEGVALDTSGNLYVAVGTSSPNFPVTVGAYSTTFTQNADECDFGNKTSALVKMSADGSDLEYATFFPYGGGMGIVVDAAGNAYMAGITCSSEFPVTQDADSTILNGYMDAVVMKVSPDGDEILYATYLGGNESMDSIEGGLDIAVDAAGNMYVVGITDSTDFPTVSPVQSSYGGGDFDAFVSKIEAPSSVQTDSDNDGVADDEDLCPGYDDNIDVDDDGIPDGCDELIDSDDDGVSDAEDQCPGYDDTIDADSDGVPDGCDPLIDSDGDGVADAYDQCPGKDDSVDVDADGIPDGCDDLIDSDGDGIADSEDICPGHHDVIDIDNDGIPDGCDDSIDTVYVAGLVPDTGQTISYTDSFGEDSDYTINPPSYTKLGYGGVELNDTATQSSDGWIMTRDNVTGLIWEIKTDTGAVLDIHEKNNTYYWCDTNPDTNGGDEGRCNYGSNTEDFIAALNDAEFGGFSDWRLPTRSELRDILDYDRNSPAINSDFFPNTTDYWYWSSSYFDNVRAWVTYFQDGQCIYEDKSIRHHVRAVRGEQKQSGFDDNGDDTVTDTKTGLMWQKQDDGVKRTWEDALLYCENAALAGYDDWRLPTIKELESIVDLTRSFPASDPIFGDTAISVCWSSTTNAEDGFTTSAWDISFSQGACLFGHNKSSTNNVRMVRGGQANSQHTIQQGFDYQSYLAFNSDLPQTWTKAQCMEHYRLFGFNEHRAVSFNLEEYLNANPDLPTNWTYEQALAHYKLFGISENRLLAFDSQEYLSLYPNLPQNWTYDQAFTHYTYFGKREGRIASFDETAYLELYPDLPSEWGQDKAFYHYTQLGRYEGRVYDPYDEDVFD